jgi:outer membrane protein, heavy metal efflux system
MKALRQIILLFIFSAMNLALIAQSNLTEILAQVKVNNLDLKAYTQLIEAKRLGLKTDNNLLNPVVEYDFMKGQPALSAGNQNDVTVLQSFDFPTTYIKKQQLLNKSLDQLEVELKDYQQELLFQTSLVYTELVYYSKLQTQFEKRLSNANDIMNLYQKKMDLGEATILELNKSKISYQKALSISEINQSKVKEKQLHLIEFNGGIEISFGLLSYKEEELDSYDAVLLQTEAGDFGLKTIKLSKAISDKNIELVRANSLPKFEVGYRYQSIIGQTFSGVHTSLTIPLFENKNKVIEAKAEKLYFDLLEAEHRNHHHHELESIYNQILAFKSNLDSYENIMETMNSEAVLLKSLESGELSLLAFFNELIYYYDATDHYLLIELEYNKSLCKLQRYSL